jgi:drug/metabolite transporter (DMT)-like permease
MRMSVGFVGTYVFDILRRAPHRPLREAFVDRPAARAMYLGVLFGPIIGVTCSLIAARNLNVAIAQTIMSMVPFVVIASAAITQRTALPWRSVVGAVLAVTGVVILAL